MKCAVEITVKYLAGNKKIVKDFEERQVLGETCYYYALIAPEPTVISTTNKREKLLKETSIQSVWHFSVILYAILYRSLFWMFVVWNMATINSSYWSEKSWLHSDLEEQIKTEI